MIQAPPSHPNLRLVGEPQALRDMATPALMLELSAFEANVRAMAEFARKHNVHLRPHAKTHKCSQIARAQMANGAIGICVAKLGEAEAMHACGIDNILITSVIATASGFRRLGVLNSAAKGLIVTVDHPDCVAKLDRAASASGRSLNVLVDLDIGLHRTGIAPGAPALALSQMVVGSKHLNFLGLQAYGGQLQHIEDYAERRAKSVAALEGLRNTRDLLIANGLSCPVVSGSGTGTCAIDVEAKLFTELQVGSYVFMDREYNDVRSEHSGLPFRTALFVETSVISANLAGIVTTDAGLKSFATEAGPPPIHSGAPEGAKYFFFGDEQGGIAFADKAHGLSLGDRVRCVTPHCDPTVNLYSHLHVMDKEKLVALWPIEARGMSF